MAAVASPAINPSMVASSRAFPLRILVDSDVVGAIIGRSGSTITSITQQSKARVDVHREENPDQKEKVITISGSLENCSEACFQILRICREENSSQLFAEDAETRDQSVVDRSYSDALHILAPSNLIGRLIGRGGATIKKIMEQTGTKIKISVNAITESTGEHIITVTGDLDNIHQSEKLISSKLRTAYLSDMNLSLQAFNHQPYLFNNVPMTYMSQGSYGPHQNPLLASMVSAQTRNNPIPRNVSMNHTHHQGQMPTSIYPGAPPYLPLYANMNVPHSTAGGLVGFNPVVSRFEHERETVYIYIPSTMVGAIIGKSGLAIKEMIGASGASIKVATTPPANPAQLFVPKEQSSNSDEPDTRQKSEQDNATEVRTITTDEDKDTASAKTSEVPASPPSRKKNAPRQKNSILTDSSLTRKVTVVGYPASQYTAQYLIYRKVSIESGKSDISLMVEIQVPSQLVGKIIGKGGTSVKNLQKQTRTTIRLPEERTSQIQQTTSTEEPSSGSSSNTNGNGYTETIVQITGEFEGSQAAQRHIRNMIRDSQFI